MWRIATVFGLVLLTAAPALGCGPSKPLTATELLKFQLPLVDRGLARETLSDAARAKIIVLRGSVEKAQMAGKRGEAREAMLTIVDMFSFKEMGGAVEPLITGCGPATRKTSAG